jgi:hypothetical protein
VQKLQAHGITATNQQSIRQLAAAHKADPDRLLGMVFLPD